jgi:hypothetical protein
MSKENDGRFTRKVKMSFIEEIKRLYNAHDPSFPLAKDLWLEHIEHGTFSSIMVIGLVSEREAAQNLLNKATEALKEETARAERAEKLAVDHGVDAERLTEALKAIMGFESGKIPAWRWSLAREALKRHEEVING